MEDFKAKAMATHQRLMSLFEEVPTENALLLQRMRRTIAPAVVDAIAAEGSICPHCVYRAAVITMFSVLADMDLSQLSSHQRMELVETTIEQGRASLGIRMQRESVSRPMEGVH